MRKFNVFLSFLILSSNLIISYNHSVSLFRIGGFKGWMAHLGVIAIELTFLQGVINILTAKYKKEKAGYPAIVGGLTGVVLVGLSNVRAGWGYGWVGVVLGVSIPLGLLISEGMLTRSFLIGEKQNCTPEIGVDWIDSYYEENNRLPSRSLVVEKLDVSEWTARKIMDDFKSKLTMKEAKNGDR